MENQDRNGTAGSSLVKLLRKITRIVQIIPFVYVFFYGLYMVGSAFLPESILCLADSLMYSSPIATGGLLVASRLLKLCRWHKAACIIPSSSQIEGFVDSFMYTFSQHELFIINTALGMVAFLFIIRAYRHFFTSDGR